jgi:hypothetical protein
MFTTIITQWDERHAPPEQPVLQVEVIGDQVFLTIAKCELTYDKTALDRIADCSVGLTELIMALGAGAQADLIESQRRKGREETSSG